MPESSLNQFVQSFFFHLHLPLREGDILVCHTFLDQIFAEIYLEVQNANLQYLVFVSSHLIYKNCFEQLLNYFFERVSGERRRKYSLKNFLY